MSDLSHLDDLVEHQDRGAEMTAKHPVTGDPMPDVVLIIAGPDSDVQRRARLKMQDELMAYRGRPPADDYERLDIERLARCVVGWRVKRDGKVVEFTFTNIVRLFTAMTFLREQADKFAASRVAYFLRTPFEETT
jgi:hypothetical protein